MKRLDRPVGWRGESYRHYLAAKSIKTSAPRRYMYTPTYVAADLPLIGADAIGTVGAASVSMIPVVVPVALAYGGASWLKKKKDRDGSYFAEKGSDFIEMDGKTYKTDDGRFVNVKDVNDVLSASPADVQERRDQMTIMERMGLFDQFTGDMLRGYAERPQPTYAAKKVDLKKYAGTWKQASVKNEPWFQKGCKNVKAKYSLNKDGTVKVVNSCDGRKVEATARSVSSDNRHLKVDFGFPFGEGDYKIKSVSPNYERAVVKSGKTEWVLVRDR